MKHYLLAFLLLTSFNACAALNKWVDADGKVHYSDSRPSDIKVQTLKSSATAEAVTPASGAGAPKSLAEREADWKKSQKTKEEAAQKADQEKEVAAIKQKNCDSARGNLSTLENTPALVTYNEKGERTFMDDVSRKQRTEEARKEVNSYCN
jgi:hypothetical protein